MEPIDHPTLYWIVGDDSQPYQQQGQNFARLPASMDMDNSDWPLLSETGSVQLPPPLQCSSSCQINPVFGDRADHLHSYNPTVAAEDQSYINKTSSHPMRTGNRSRNASGKSEVRKLSGGDAKLEVVFQKLNVAKKGIPDDGHRGWKKYGNKSIQNSNHCRGYYKCSVKECRAKKMVQPTDKDPTLFEVTYVGKHTCSSTGQRRSRSTTTAPAPVDTNDSSKPAKEEDRKSKRSGAGMELDDGSILTGTEGNGWSGIILASSSTKRGRSEEHDKASLDNYSYLTSTTTTASEDRDVSIDTYLHHGSRHHQAVYSLSAPLQSKWKS